MAQKLNREAIAQHATLHDSLPALREAHVVDRSFEMPKGIYMTVVGCYLAFLAITGTAFANPGLIIPMAIFAFFIIAGFALPTVWVKLAPEAPAKAKSWARFQREGIRTLTRHNTADAATVQVLILPVLLVVWGLAVVTIAALVR